MAILDRQSLPVRPRRHNLVGLNFGRLTVLARAPADPRLVSRQTRWECACECGGTAVVTAGNLRIGKTNSCGCLSAEATAQRQTIHGQTNSSEYSSWEHMISRCHNPNNDGYALYGGQGVAVCDRWRFGEDGKTGFECFLADLGPKPQSHLSIDRYPDHTGDYRPGNARWASPSQQSNNKRTNKFIEFGGATMTVADACRASGTTVILETVHSRLRLGWPIERALSVPPDRRHASKRKRT